MTEQDVRKTLDLHFSLMESIKAHYRMRDKQPDALDKAILYCNQQIELAPTAAVAFEIDYKKEGALPSHTGYEQLAIIREKHGGFAEAIALCEEAKRQGWGEGCTKGRFDWDKRINRCSKKLAKSAPPLPVTPAIIHVTCSSCGQGLNISGKYAGQRGKCNHCGGLVEVPG